MVSSKYSLDKSGYIAKEWGWVSGWEVLKGVGGREGALIRFLLKAGQDNETSRVRGEEFGSDIKNGRRAL